MGNVKSKRNTTLDLFKLIASFMVVFIHVGMYGKADLVADGLARFAVPLFFISAGFFAYGNDIPKLRKKTVSVLRLFIFSVVLYYVYGVIMKLASGGVKAAVGYLAGAAKIKNIIKFLVFNETYSSLLLWFLAALIYVYIVQMIVCKLKIGERVIFPFCIAGVAVTVLLGEGMNVAGITLPGFLTRNFLLPGYAFFGMGLLARKNEDKLASVRTSAAVVSLIVGAALSITSACLFLKAPCYLGSLFTLFGMIVISVKYPVFKHSEKLGVLLASSKYIYIFHVILSAIYSRIAVHAGVDTASPLYVNIRPFAVIVITTLVSMLAIVIERTFKSRKKKI